MSGSVCTSDRISAKVISATIVPFMLLRHVAVRIPPLRNHSQAIGNGHLSAYQCAD
jgi:hypothetical protein